MSEKDGSETTVQAPIGQHLLEVAHKNDIELEGMCPSRPRSCSQSVLGLGVAAANNKQHLQEVMPS